MKFAGCNSKLYTRKPGGEWEEVPLPPGTIIQISTTHQQVPCASKFAPLPPPPISFPMTITQWPPRGSHAWVLRQMFSLN